MLTGAHVVQEASWPRFAPTHILSKSHKDASGGRVSLRRHRNKQADQRRSAAGDWWKFQRHHSCWGNMKLISRRGGGIKGDRWNVSHSIPLGSNSRSGGAVAGGCIYSMWSMVYS